MAIITNSPFGVLRGSVGELTCQVVGGRNIMRAKPYNLPPTTPAPVQWPYPISDEVKEYVDQYYTDNKEEIDTYWYPKSEEVTEEEDFKRTNYINCEMCGISELNIQLGRGSLAAAMPAYSWGKSTEQGKLNIALRTYNWGVYPPGSVRIRVTTRDSQRAWYEKEFANTDSSVNMPFYTTFTGSVFLKWRIYAYDVAGNIASPTIHMVTRAHTQ